MRRRLWKLLPLVLLAGCTGGGAELPAGRSVDLSGISHEMMVLGERLADPYSVENVRLAVRSLYPEKVRQDIRPTDMYVRFLPEDETQYERLLSMGFELLDHPLDHRIVLDGDYYHDPEIAADRITWQYVVVPAGTAFPDGIRCEVLDECYIAEHDTQTRADGIDWAAVEREAFRLTGNGDLLTPGTRAEEGEALAPAGRITLLDEECNQGVPEGLSGVKVVVNSFVKFATAYTDDEGCYEMAKKFTGDVQYRLMFKNRRGFAIGVNLVLIPASLSTLGKHSPAGIDVEVDRYADWKLFTRCVVNNATAAYYDRCEETGDVSAPPAGLRLWIFRNLRSSSTPMLQQGVLVDSGKLGEFLGDYASLVKMFLPDVTLGLKNCTDYASIYAETVHELAHASHFVRAGKSYWAGYVHFILRSFITSLGITYGTGLEQDAGYCEVGEMWGYFFGNLLFRERYGRGSAAEGMTQWFYPQILMYLEDRGVDAAKIFDALGPEVTSRDAFQSALSDRYPEHYSVISQAFDRYRY